MPALRYFKGTCLMNVLLRALGARVGLGAVVETTEVMDWDLVTLTGNAILLEEASVSGGTAEADRMVLEPVRVNALVGVRAHVAPGSVIERPVAPFACSVAVHATPSTSPPVKHVQQPLHIWLGAVTATGLIQVTANYCMLAAVIYLFYALGLNVSSSDFAYSSLPDWAVANLVPICLEQSWYTGVCRVIDTSSVGPAMPGLTGLYQACPPPLGTGELSAVCPPVPTREVSALSKGAFLAFLRQFPSSEYRDALIAQFEAYADAPIDGAGMAVLLTSFMLGVVVRPLIYISLVGLVRKLFIRRPKAGDPAGHDFGSAFLERSSSLVEFDLAKIITALMWRGRWLVQLLGGRASAQCVLPFPLVDRPDLLALDGAVFTGADVLFTTRHHSPEGPTHQPITTEELAFFANSAVGLPGCKVGPHGIIGNRGQAA